MPKIYTKICYGQTVHWRQRNVTHAHCMLDNYGYTHTHTERVKLLFHGNNGYANAVTLHCPSCPPPVHRPTPYSLGFTSSVVKPWILISLYDRIGRQAFVISSSCTACIWRNLGCKCVCLLSGCSYQCLWGGHSTAEQTLMVIFFFFAKTLYNYTYSQRIHRRWSEQEMT